jgi:hypothetical protein
MLLFLNIKNKIVYLYRNKSFGFNLMNIDTAFGS